MSDFVYDGTTVPDGKSDSAPLGVSANKGVTAAEWNTTLQAIKDLRHAILTGNFHGLSDSAASLSPVGGSVVRSHGGTAEISQNGDRYRRVLPANRVHVRDYGAKGDGITDDAAAIQAAITDALSRGAAVEFDALTYLVGSEITVAGQISMRGAGHTKTTLHAAGAMRSVLYLHNANRSLLSDFSVNGGNTATSCLLLDNASESQLINLEIYGAKVDGLALVDNNDDLKLHNVSLQTCGSCYASASFATDMGFVGVRHAIVAGSVATTLASPVVTGTGTSFLAIGARVGDPMLIGAYADGAAAMYSVLSVDSDTQITLAQSARASVAGKVYAIGVGDGLHSPRAGDNNLLLIEGGIARSNAGFAFGFDNAYGPLLKKVQIDFQPFWAMRFGTSHDAPNSICRVENCYFEQINSQAMVPASVILNISGGLVVTSPLSSTSPVVENQQGSVVMLRDGLIDCQGVDRLVRIADGELLMGNVPSVDDPYFYVRRDGSVVIGNASGEELGSLRIGNPGLPGVAGWIKQTPGLFKIGYQFGHDFTGLSIDYYGTITQRGQIGAAGSQSPDNPAGINSMASGATTCVITCADFAGTDSMIFLTWMGDLGTQTAPPWVERAAGHFTVHVQAAPTGDVPFCWEIRKLVVPV